MALLVSNKDYIALLDTIKRDIASTRARAVRAVNSDVILMYWRIGRHINAHAEWGDGFIGALSTDIRREFPGVKGFSVRYLRYMAKFAREADEQIVQTVFAQLGWSHNIALMDKVKDPEIRTWYAKESIGGGWSLQTMKDHIDSDLFGRQVLAEKVSNFHDTLPSPQDASAEQMMKDPYVFGFIENREDPLESELEDEMMRNITKLLLELGTGFAFMGRQYHLQVSDHDYYIDLLFYNTRIHAYVVIELKTVEFKPEFAGKLNVSLSAVDDLVAGPGDNPSVGILLCRGKDNQIAQYALKDINKPIGVSEYRLSDVLPADLVETLPSPEDFEGRV